MAKIEKLEDIIAWQRARELTAKIYKFTSNGAFARDFGLRDQVRKASVSVASNIAEGFGRGGNKEFIQFLSTAKGSLYELRTQLYIANDLKYITEEDFRILNTDIDDTARLISGFINYLKTTEMRGNKFKK